MIASAVQNHLRVMSQKDIFDRLSAPKPENLSEEIQRQFDIDFLETELAKRHPHLAEDDVEIVKTLKKRSEYSPDFFKLKLHNYIPVFLYDDCQRKMRNNDILRFSPDNHYLGEAKTCADDYIMRGWSRPVVMPLKKKSQTGLIKGEVYAIRPETLLELDHFQSNDKAFKRVTKHVVLTEQNERKNGTNYRPTMYCHMYIGIPDYWVHFDLPVMEIFTSPMDMDVKYFKFTGQKTHRPFDPLPRKPGPILKASNEWDYGEDESGMTPAEKAERDHFKDYYQRNQYMH